MCKKSSKYVLYFRGRLSAILVLHLKLDFESKLYMGFNETGSLSPITVNIEN
jgi:hypothetical protein